MTPCRTDSRQRGSVEHLDVVVGVDVDHPGHDPLAGRVDDLRAPGLVEGRRGDRGHPPVPDADVPDRGGAAGAVEPPAVLDDRVVAHRAIEPA